jgi:hypothetical protein
VISVFSTSNPLFVAVKNTTRFSTEEPAAVDVQRGRARPDGLGRSLRRAWLARGLARGAAEGGRPGASAPRRVSRTAWPGFEGWLKQGISAKIDQSLLKNGGFYGELMGFKLKYQNFERETSRTTSYLRVNRMVPGY